MRRVISALLLALVALGPVEAFQVSALTFTVGSAHTVVSPATGTGAQQGTVLMVLRPQSTASVLRHLFGESPSSGMSAFTRAADGTSIRVQIFRGAGTPQQVDSPSGMLAVGRPLRLVVQWDTANSPALYYGYENSALVNGSTSATAGSGTHSTSNAVWTVGSSTAAGMDVWVFGVSDAVLTTQEMDAYFRHPDRPFRANRLSWALGRDGSYVVKDLTGNGYHGTVSGPSLTPAVAPFIFVRRPT